MKKNIIRLLKKNCELNPSLYTSFYNEQVNELVRKKYTISDEFAILRQRDEKPEEFAIYNAYVEECKEKVKKELEEAFK